MANAIESCHTLDREALEEGDFGVAGFGNNVLLAKRAYAVESDTDGSRMLKGAHRFVMIGDSYAIPRNIAHFTPWPELVASRLGLEDNEVTYIRKAGYGFAKRGHRFMSLIAQQPVDESVTDVLIVGGIGNDRYSSTASIKKCYRKTIRKLKAKYPNARIMHAIVNWRPYDAFYQKVVSTRICLYRFLARKCGVVYLKGCENVLKKHPGWYLDDDVHPNRIGSIAIARRVANRLKAYS